MARPKEFEKDIALEKAMHTFWTKGYEGTSISDLTATMEISRSSLYETFGDKKDLFLETLNHYLEMTGRKRVAVFANAASVKQGLADFLHGTIDFVLNEEHPGGCFFTNTAIALETLEEQFQTVIKLGLEKQEADFYAFLDRGQQNGEIAPDKDIHALARFLVGLVRGMTVIARIHKDRKMLEDMVRIGLEVFD